MRHINSSMATHETSQGRCIALFPGAFRPPHLAHFETVLNLVSRADIDEVIIIITNRCRHIPGTSKALETDIAIKIWSIYLMGLPKVRVEVAPNSAVKHAQSYFERVNKNDTLLFCAGVSELKEGLGRFSKINDLSKKYAITASVIASSPPPLIGGATAIRSQLAKGISGYEAFIAALPNHLNSTQREQVWIICSQSMIEMDDIAKRKIIKIIEQQDLGNIKHIDIAKKDKPDPVHCIQLTTGKRLFVKYANDTVKAAKLGQPFSLKPRTRLYAERRALKWLERHSKNNIKHPKIIYFENKSKTLVLSEVCPEGDLLEEDLKQGIFDHTVAWKISDFLAHCHRMSTVNPFWGKTETDDLQHWNHLLHLRTLGLLDNIAPSRVKQQLENLKCISEIAIQPGFYHLDFCPKNIRLLDKEIGIFDFELSSSIADSAYDFGFLLGHYLFWGILTSSQLDCLQAIQSAINSYSKIMDHSWPNLCPRTVKFAGAAIIYCLNNNKQPRETTVLLMNVAETLLEQNIDSFEAIIQLFRQILIIQTKYEATY